LLDIYIIGQFRILFRIIRNSKENKYLADILHVKKVLILVVKYVSSFTGRLRKSWIGLLN